MYSNIPDPVVTVVDGKNRFVCPIPDCPHEKAREGYATRRSYARHYEDFHVQSENVGFMSRLDWGSPGFRKGLIDAAFEIFKEEKVRFVVLAGGLVSFPHMRKDFTTTALRAVAYAHDFYTETASGREIEDIAQAREYLLDKAAEELAEALPRIKSGAGYTKIYIVTSPAPNYDCWIGAEVARRLVALRPDIRFWGERSARFPLKNQNKLIWVLAPLKASWRSKYHSTAVDRLIEDEERQTSQDLPDLWVVGCTASSLQRPQGEKKRPYISVPALHKLQETHTAENQVGALVVEFIPGSDNFLVRDYTLKDQTSRETEWVPEPETEDELQRAIVQTLKKRGGLTVGMLEDLLRAPRTRITKAIAALNDSGYKPRIEMDMDSGIYSFDLDWIRNQLVYPAIDLKGLSETSLLEFGCLHAGSIYSEYGFFVNEVPRLALEHDISILAGAGDFVEGTEHNLIEKGEVMGGFNNTDQELLAARLVCTVIGKIFEARFAKLAGRKHKLAGEDLKHAIESCLVTFIYAVGNHDAWIGKRGVTPLTTFQMALARGLRDKVAKILNTYELEYHGLTELVESKIQSGEVFQLPTGQEITVIHPFMARAMTSSLRAQHTLDLVATRLVAIANFHVAVKVGQWDADLGQRVACQVGAIVWKTDFEHSKLKRLDVGVGYVRVLANSEGRIQMTETAFFGGGDRKQYDNTELRDAFMEKLGV